MMHILLMASQYLFILPQQKCGQEPEIKKTTKKHPGFDVSILKMIKCGLKASGHCAPRPQPQSPSLCCCCSDKLSHGSN